MYPRLLDAGDVHFIVLLTDQSAEVVTAPSLAYFDISSNQMSGTLPPDWTQNLGLAFFKADNNQLTGWPHSSDIYKY